MYNPERYCICLCLWDNTLCSLRKLAFFSLYTMFLKVHANMIRVIMMWQLCADTIGNSNSFFVSLAADPKWPAEVLFFLF